MPAAHFHLDVPESRMVAAPALLLSGWVSHSGIDGDVQVLVDGNPEPTRQLIRFDVERKHPSAVNNRGFEAVFDPAESAPAPFPPGELVDLEISARVADAEVGGTTVRYRRTPCPIGRVNLFLIGASRSGTTSLHELLDASPELCMSRPKEPGYFRAEQHRGPGFYWRRYFAHHRGEHIVGDACPDNLASAWVAPRIHEYNPEARLLVCLRHPYERTYSHWRQLAQHPEFDVPFAAFFSESAALGPEPPGPEAIEEGFRDQISLRRNSQFWKTSALASSGRYAERLASYFELFPRDRIHVMIFEELLSAQQRTLAGLVEFLGVDPDPFGPLDLPHRNASSVASAADSLPAARAAMREYFEPLHGQLEELIGRRIPWTY